MVIAFLFSFLLHLLLKGLLSKFEDFDTSSILSKPSQVCMYCNLQYYYCVKKLVLLTIGELSDLVMIF